MARFYGLPLGLLLASLLLWGVSTIPAPALASLAIQAAHPWQDWGQATYHWSHPGWLLLAGLVGATTPAKLAALGAVVNLAALPVLWVLAHRRYGREVGRLVALLFLASPMWYVLHTWIGLEDGLVVMCTTVLLLSRSALSVGMAAMVGVFVHPVVLPVAGVLVLLRTWDEPQSEERMLRSVVLGLMAGELLCELVRPFDFYPQTRLDYILAVPWSEWWAISTAHLPLALYTLGFALWVPLVLALRLLWADPERRWYCKALVGYLVLAVLLAGVTRDTTRVLALLTWAPVLHCLVAGYTSVPPTNQVVIGGRPCFMVSTFDPPDPAWVRVCSVTSLAAYFGLLAPHFYLWDGQIGAVAWLSWIGG